MKLKITYKYFCFLLLVVSYSASAQPAGVLDPFSRNLSGFSVEPGNVEVVAIADKPTVTEAQKSVLLARETQLSQGWIEVNQQRASMVENYVSNARSKLNSNMGVVRESLHTEPAKLSGTILEGAGFVGAFPVGGFVDGSWTGVVRVFESSELGRIVLEEYDYKRAGSNILIPEEVVDSYFNGLPLLYAVLKSGDTAHTDITWFTDNKQFRMRIGSMVSKTDKNYESVEQIISSLR
jgi:hypothetical protein